MLPNGEDSVTTFLHLANPGRSGKSFSGQPTGWPSLLVTYMSVTSYVSLQFSSVVQSAQLFVTPWTAARQASLSITISWSSPKPMSIEAVKPSNYLSLCRPLLLLPSIFPRIRVFSNKSALLIRWSKYWSFSFGISPYNKHP